MCLATRALIDDYFFRILYTIIQQYHQQLTLSQNHIKEQLSKDIIKQTTFHENHQDSHQHMARSQARVDELLQRLHERVDLARNSSIAIQGLWHNIDSLRSLLTDTQISSDVYVPSYDDHPVNDPQDRRAEARIEEPYTMSPRTRDNTGANNLQTSLSNLDIRHPNTVKTNTPANKTVDTRKEIANLTYDDTKSPPSSSESSSPSRSTYQCDYYKRQESIKLAETINDTDAHHTPSISSA